MCSPAVIDRVYGTASEPVVLCPECGEIVPVDGLPGGATAIPDHPTRVAG